MLLLPILFIKMIYDIYYHIYDIYNIIYDIYNKIVKKDFFL